MPLGGSDDVSGGLGWDEIAFFSSVRPVRVYLARGTASGQGHDQMTGIEAVIGSRGNDWLEGDGHLNAFSGLEGNDYVDGRGGSDSIDAGAGSDLCLDGASVYNGCENQDGSLIVPPPPG